MVCAGELELFDLNSNATTTFLEAIVKISRTYSSVHKYIVVPLCLLGSLTNTLHLFVLTRPNMKKSSVNQLISLIALCDIWTMVSYTIYETRFDLLSGPADHSGFSIQWVIFAIAHGVISVALHTITLFLWVTTAYIRFQSIKDVNKHGQKSYVCHIFAVICVLVTILCIPSLLIHDIIIVQRTEEKFLYSIGVSKIAAGNNCLLFKLNLWLTGILFKAIPSVLLVVFTVALFTELKVKQEKRKLLININSENAKKYKTKADRMTMMLVVLLSVFVFTELPQGALAILNGLYPNDIHQLIYSNLGEILDLLSLINCNTCFVIYALMSSAYRRTLQRILQNIIQKLPPVKTTVTTIIRNRSDTSLQPSQYIMIDNDTYL